MKKITTIVILICAGYVTHAQLHIGINTNALYPSGESGNEIDYGYGAGITAGYLLNNSLDVSLGIQQMKLNSIIHNYKIRSEYVKLNYILNISNLRPYLGSKTGIYHKSYKIAYNTSTETAFGIAPELGVRCHLGQSKKLLLDVNGCYSVAFFDRQYSSISMGIALMVFI